MSQHWTLKKKLFLTFATIVVLASTLIGIAVVSTAKLLDAVKWNSHTYAVLDQSQGMLLNMVNIETGLRGFVAGGDDKFLEPFTQGEKAFGEHFAKAKTLTSDNPAQQARLDTLMTHHKAFMQVANNLIQLRRDATAGRMMIEDLIKEFSAGKDKAAMDAFRAEIAQFSDAESALLVERSEELQSTASFTTITLEVGSVALLVVAGLLGLGLARSILTQLGGEPSAAMQVAEKVANTHGRPCAPGLCVARSAGAARHRSDWPVRWRRVCGASAGNRRRDGAGGGRADSQPMLHPARHCSRDGQHWCGEQPGSQPRPVGHPPSGRHDPACGQGAVPGQGRREKPGGNSAAGRLTFRTHDPLRQFRGRAAPAAGAVLQLPL